MNINETNKYETFIESIRYSLNTKIFEIEVPLNEVKEFINIWMNQKDYPLDLNSNINRNIWSEETENLFIEALFKKYLISSIGINYPRNSIDLNKTICYDGINKLKTILKISSEQIEKIGNTKIQFQVTTINNYEKLIEVVRMLNNGN